MDLININKYESIADRIKRLGQQNQQATATPTFPNMTSPRTPPASSYNQYQRKQPIQTYKPSYFQKKTTSRVATQDTEQTPNQQSYTIIDDLRTFRESQYNTSYGQERTTVGFAYAQSQFMEELEKERKNKQETSKFQIEPRSRILSKIKSQNSLKIDEILQSYNSYKQNKEQFISEIKKNSQLSHNRSVSQTIKKPNIQQKQPINDVSFEKKPNKPVILNSIDNLWNQAAQVKEDENTIPINKQFEERNRAEQIMMRVASLRRQQTQQTNKNTDISNNEAKNQTKYILKNLNTDINPKEKEEQSKLGLALSPRGLRAPGKICKNHDKSMVSLRRYES